MTKYKQTWSCGSERLQRTINTFSATGFVEYLSDLCVIPVESKKTVCDCTTEVKHRSWKRSWNYLQQRLTRNWHYIVSITVTLASSSEHFFNVEMHFIFQQCAIAVQYIFKEYLNSISINECTVLAFISSSPLAWLAVVHFVVVL